MNDNKLIRFLTIIICCTINFAAFAQEENDEELNHHCLYEEKSLTVGIGGIYSLDVDLLGINGRMYYNLGESICFGPEYAYFKSEEYEIADLDFVVHYIFETPWVGIYPVVGVNYTVESDLEHEETMDRLGVIFGAGVHRNFKNCTFFMEYSRVELGIDDQFVTGGVMYNFR